jgi:ADP-dependent NAD(P)H-hydrate dehydratase / NAD(P)H-hydrate epimerase
VVVIPIVTPAEMRAIDAAAAEPTEVLIDRAGRATSRAALDMLGGTYGRVVNVIAGSGNNGADGRTAAMYLQRRGVKVRVIDAGTRPATMPACDLVIDAAFGTGFRGEWDAPEVGDAAVLAVDIPSGVDALTGHAGPGVLPADRTVTFQALKPGLVFGAGSRLAGDVEVVDIGLDVSSATQHLVERSDVASWWPVRAVDGHKWRGAVRVVAGSAGMFGAAHLCSAAAARAGAGLVTLSSPGLDGVDPSVRSEVIQRRLPASGFAGEVLDDIGRFGALVVGPGLGRDERVVAAVRQLVGGAPLPVVVDGDGLFALSGDQRPLLRGRENATVLTPHDGEYETLAGSPPGTDRVAATRRLAADLDCTVLLKGPTTVVATPSGDVLVVDHGDERLATAGSGDVLAGIIAAALAAGAAPDRAAAASAWLHAEAALAGPVTGLLAGDLLDLLPDALAGLR